MTPRAASAKSDKPDELILYRLKAVEDAVKDVGLKLERQDNIKRSDLVEFRETIVARFNEVRDGLQKQLDDINESKATTDKVEELANRVEDLRTLVKAVGAFLSSLIAALIIYYLTSGHKS